MRLTPRKPTTGDFQAFDGVDWAPVSRDTARAFLFRNVNQTAYTTSYQITPNDGKVRMDCTSGALNATLPANPLPGQHHIIQKTDASGNAVTVVGTIDGVASPTISTQYGLIRCMWSGSVWESC